MSRKTELEADLKRVGYQLGGSHLTRQARGATFGTFASTMRQLGYGIHCASQIGGKHLQAFVGARAAEGISARTCANEMSHLRAVLCHVGKQGLARNPAYSNAALGIERGVRIGTKQPLSDSAIQAFQDRMAGLGRPSLGAVLELQRGLGLREAEAIRAGQSDTLSRWQRELTERGSVRVVEGTKGGRPREVHPANLDRALTEQYWVQGPVAVLLTTTSATLDEETASRFLTVSIDESTAMTERIFERQREADTLSGYLRQLDHQALIRQHQSAQRLLEPVAVLNPYAPQLQFPAHSLRARRDHKKYLMLIKAIAFLHQQQRPVKEHLHGDQVLRYIEVTREDIRAANVIAQSVLAQSASELSAPARALLTYIHAHVKEHCAAEKLDPHGYTFNRKRVREGIGWSDWQIRTHIRELEQLEYLKARSGAWGKEYQYELVGNDADAGALGLTLTDPDTLREPMA